MPRRMKDVPGFMNYERLAGLATVNSQNEPHVVPVFFTYDDGKVYIQTGRNTVKIHNLKTNDNVAVAVYRDEEAVIIRGKGRVVDREDEFVKRTQDHIDKYQLQLDKQGRDTLGIPLFNRKIRCVVEVTPRRTTFW